MPTSQEKHQEAARLLREARTRATQRAGTTTLTGIRHLTRQNRASDHAHRYQPLPAADHRRYLTAQVGAALWTIVHTRADHHQRLISCDDDEALIWAARDMAGQLRDSLETEERQHADIMDAAYAYAERAAWRSFLHDVRSTLEGTGL
jgi:hypothetical protein